jgi:hypothetical protein
VIEAQTLASPTPGVLLRHPDSRPDAVLEHRLLRAARRIGRAEVRLAVGGGESVPFAAHELQAVGRIGDDGVHRLGGHRGHDFDAVPQVEDDVTIIKEGSVQWRS